MTPEEVTTAFIAAVRRLLKAKNLSQREFAKTLGVSEQNVSRMLSGRVSTTADTIAQVCTALGVSVCDLFCEPKKPKPKK